MSPAAWELQTAVMATLRAALATAGPGGSAVPVLDDVPQGQAYPYVAVGDMTVADASDKTEDGEDHSITLHVWSRYAGRKEVKGLLADIKSALHDQALSVTGHDLVMLRFEFANDFLDPDGKTRHGVIRFGAMTNPQ